MDRTRINLANPLELLEIPGIDQAKAEAILRHRVEHGPIRDTAELTTILGPGGVTGVTLAHIAFEPADDTAPEAPGA